MSKDGAIGATLSVTQTVALFTVIMPPVAEINRTSPDVPFTSDVRQSMLVAGGLSIAVSLVNSHLDGSWTPLVVTSLLVTVFIVAYEYTMRKPGRPVNLASVTTTGSESA